MVQEIFHNDVPLWVESYAITNLGEMRKNNEDNFLLDNKFVLEEQFAEAGVENIEINGGTRPISDLPQLFSVCDGMGGEECGEVASKLTVQTFAEIFMRQKPSDPVLLEMENAMQCANERVFAQVEERGLRRIGSTAALVYICGGNVYIANVGDSRIYLCRQGEFSQLSRDHTELRYAVEAGFISEEEARMHPLRHRLTQSIGMDPEEMRMTPYSLEVGAAQSGDCFLLCSDGLTDMVDDKEIRQTLCSDMSAEGMAKVLIQKALESGGKDNVTVLIAHIFSKD